MGKRKWSRLGCGCLKRKSTRLLLTWRCGAKIEHSDAGVARSTAQVEATMGVGPKVIVAQRDALILRLTEVIRRSTEASFNSAPFQSFRMIISGGTVMQILNQIETSFLKDWTRVLVYFADERCVPQKDEQCNCGDFFRGPFFKNTRIPRENVFCINHALYNDAIQCGSDYQIRIENSFANTTDVHFDLALLGIGEDGHTASLFPGRNFSNEHELIEPVFNAPKPPPTRITMTLHALKTLCKEQIFIAIGEGKNPVLRKIINERIISNEIPASLFPSCLYLLDEESGRDLMGKL